MTIFNKAPTFSKLSLIFLVVIASLTALTISQTDTKLKAENEQKLLSKTEQSLDQVISFTSDQAYVYKIMDKILQLSKETYDQNKLSKFVTEAEKRYKLSLQVFIFENTSPIISISSDDNTKALINKLPFCVEQTGEIFLKAQREIKDDLMHLFGPGSRLEVFQIWKGLLKKYRSNQSNGFIYWDKIGNRFYFLLANHIPNFIERFKIYMNNNNDKQNLGAASPENNQWIPPAGFSSDQMRSTYLKCSLEGKNHCEGFNHIWYYAKGSKGNIWCATSPIPDYSNPLLSILFYMCSALALISFILYFLAGQNIFPGSYVCNKLDAIQIKYRLSALFGMASVFPIILTIFIGFSSIIDKKEVIQNRVLSNSISSLNQLDQLYTVNVDITKELTNELREKISKTPATAKLLNDLLEKYNITKTLTSLETRDEKGNILFSTIDPTVQGSSKAMEFFSKIATKHHAPSKMGNAINKVTPSEIVVESIFSSDSMGMSSILRQRGKIWMAIMGTFPVIWYWDVYPDKSAETTFVFFSNQVALLYKDTINKTLSDRLLSSGTFQLSLELNREFFNLNWTPNTTSLKNNILKDSAVRAFTTDKLLFRETTINNKKYWVTIKAEKKMQTSVFLNFTPMEKEMQVLTTMKWQLFGGGILSLIISLLSANLISRLITVPIEDISRGISAIRNRDNSIRIPIRRNDEFGKVADAFNTVIEDLKELEYGKVVQNKLLPSNPASPEGYDLACFTSSATDLAGDYHDVIHLNNKKHAIILGDVTGHGISAALAMAMAKATVDYQDLDGSKFPSSLLDQLNSLFNKELKPKHKFMTFVCMVLDPETHTLEIENAGQSYPFYFNAKTDTIREIPIPSMPLGATKKRRGKGTSLTMEPGDGIILYSDGIIECSNSKDVMFGYPRFMELFKKLLKEGLPSAEILKTIMKTLDDFRVEGPYPDDVTLVTIQRKHIK